MSNIGHLEKVCSLLVGSSFDRLDHSRRDVVVIISTTALEADKAAVVVIVVMIAGVVVIAIKTYADDDYSIPPISQRYGRR